MLGQQGAGGRSDPGERGCADRAQRSPSRIPLPRPLERGFTLIELVVVVAVMATVAAIAIGVSPDFVRFAKAEGGVGQAADMFRFAKEAAVSQRRNMLVRFIGSDAIQVARVELNGAEPTVLRTVQFENRMQFLLVTAVPDTPDLFGNGAAINFGTTGQRMFTSEGSFVDANGEVLNGSLFLAIPDDPMSARAITVFGATAFIHIWQWDGRAWRD